MNPIPSLLDPNLSVFLPNPTLDLPPPMNLEPSLPVPTHPTSSPPSAVSSQPRDPSPPPRPPSPPLRDPSPPPRALSPPPPPKPSGIASRTRTRQQIPSLPSTPPKPPGQVKTLASKRKPSHGVVPESTPDSPPPLGPAKRPTFTETISLRKLLPERLLDYLECTSLGLYDIIEFHGWKESVSALRVPCPSLVHEFYSNLSADVIDPVHENFGKVFLRGNWISFTPLVIAECLHLPLLDEPTFSAEFTPGMDEVARTLTGNSSSTWPTSNAVLAAELTPLYHILHVVAVFNWQPTAHKSTVGADLARFLFAVGTLQSISLPHCLFQVILEAAMWPGVSRILPLPCLIQRIAHCFSAVPSKSMDTRISLKVINLASTRSKAKKKGPTVKDPMAASSLGVKQSSWKYRLFDWIHSFSTEFQSFKSEFRLA
ncbi:uncharacterized protein LOC133806512 [Humulus lupulus]|uniref:uncharacterized protein LOC133806512 n=1 Tax=Humulus lupulus TaxID=3486 RepID=UPI002B403E84|nr:uncharacterized protein LOC133806512 [Humulus lupulus]